MWTQLQRTADVRIALRAVALIAAALFAPSMAGAAPCSATFYPRVGSATPSRIVARGPGLVLMGGGTDTDAAFRWIAITVAGSASRSAGDLVVLRASGDNDYDKYIEGLGRYNSVRTLLLPPCSSRVAIAQAAAIVSRAQSVFFAGGDQADYVIWKGGPIASAVQGVYDRGGVVGGTSAGLAILGQYIFDAVAGDRTHDVHTADAVPDPRESAISFTEGMFAFPFLRGVITDTHFRQRDRFGRLVAFIALLRDRGEVARGIGVDARSALAVDRHGIATLLLQGSGGRALFLRGGTVVRLETGRPLVYRGIDVILLDRAGATFDLQRWCGDGREYNVDVDGEAREIYTPANPYIAPAESRSAACPR
jgi:cyanophycinase